MCFWNSKDASLLRSKKFDKQIKNDERRLQKEVKLLLLGMRATSWRPVANMLPAESAIGDPWN